MKATKQQITFYKSQIVEPIYKHLGGKMTKKEIDKDIKINADFPYESTTDERCTTEDMQNLIVWGFIYGDSFGLELDYLEY